MSRGVEALFIPGQQLSLEAESLMVHLRNCGARMNRLKVARASPDAPMWWQFLSSADGSSEMLDRTAFDLHCVLRDLEQATSDLKRLCIAPASDVAGNVQHEMAKKKWATATLSRWEGVLKNATQKRAVSEVDKMRAAQQEQQQKQLQQKQQQQQKQQEHQQQSSPRSTSKNTNEDNNNNVSSLSPESFLSPIAREQHQQRQQQEERRSQALLAMSPSRQQLVKKVLDAQTRVEKLQDQLEVFESSHTSSLKLAQKLSDLDEMEKRFNNVRTRRVQFEEQVRAHLQGIAAEISKEADGRRQRGREFYDENHPADLRPTPEEEEEMRLSQERRRRRKLRGPRADKSGDGGAAGGAGNDNKASFSADGLHGDGSTTEDVDAFWCDECRDKFEEIEKLESERRAQWVNRAVRVLCTQAADPAQVKSESRSVVPSKRLLAVVGSRKEDGKPAVVVPLISRKDRELMQKQKQQRGVSGGSDRSISVPALSSDGRDAVWQIPSAHDHSKYWTVHLAI